MKTLTSALLLAPFLALAAAADVTKDDIRRLHVAGVSDDVIVAYVNSHRPVKINAEEFAELKREGVSEKVLAALAASEPATAPRETYVYTPPAYYSGYSYPYYTYPYYSYSYYPYYRSYPYYSFYYGYPYYSHHRHGHGAYYHHGGHKHSGTYYHGGHKPSGGTYHHGGHSRGTYGGYHSGGRSYHGGGARSYGGGGGRSYGGGKR